MKYINPDRSYCFPVLPHVRFPMHSGCVRPCSLSGGFDVSFEIQTLYRFSLHFSSALFSSLSIRRPGRLKKPSAPTIMEPGADISS